MRATQEEKRNGPTRHKSKCRASCQSPDGKWIEISLTRHALERFGERVRPALEDEEALAMELSALIYRFGRVLNKPPAWQAERGRQTSDLYIELGEDLIVAINRDGTRYFATTVLTRTGISERARESRNRRNRLRRRSRNTRRRNN